MIVKNSYGVSIVLGSVQKRKLDPDKSIFSGSSLDRKISKSKPYPKKKPNSALVERSMSKRTKSKVRKKAIAFCQVFPTMTFVTLTFVNKVADQKAIIILRKFLDNMKKTKPGFEYLWVAERQTKNETFKGNIHFHLLTNKYFKLPKTWEYWIQLQAKNEIQPREQNFKPSSAFDVRRVATKNPKRIATYLTKYITKNQGSFNCQVWNCSKGVSMLYTDFYSSPKFLDELKRLKGKEIKEIEHEYCSINLVPIDRETMRLYNRLRDENKKILNVI
ncbi:MAG: hypothetical protein JXR19_01750 [Bacteroidia bacterium]